MITTEDGLKVRKLVELMPTTAKEYKEAMLDRVDYFSKKYASDSIFNNFVENTVVKGLKNILDIKVKTDEILGDRKDAVQKAIQKVLLLGL